MLALRIAETSWSWGGGKVWRDSGNLNSRRVLKNSKFSKIHGSTKKSKPYQGPGRMFKKARPARPQAARSPRLTGEYVEGFEQRERRWRTFSTSC